MLDLEIFAAALRDDKRLRREAGPDAVFCVAPELHSVFLVQKAEDGTQAGTVAIVGSGGGVVGVVDLPRSFQVRTITHDDARFALTSADGRTATGTPDQFDAHPRLVAESVNPRYQEQLEEIFLNTHLLRNRAVAGIDAPTTDQGLDGPELDEIIRLGEAMVTVADEELWLKFDNAWPEKVSELLPHTRDLLARLDHLGRAGAEFLWAEVSPGDEPESDFLEMMTPTSLVMFLTGDFEIHYEGISDTEYYMDGYWPAVHFLANGTPVDHAIEA